MTTRAYICILICWMGAVSIGAADPNSSTASERIDQYLSDLLEVVDGGEEIEAGDVDEQPVQETEQQDVQVVEQADPNMPAETGDMAEEAAELETNQSEDKQTDSAVNEAKTGAAGESESLIKQVRRATYLPLEDGGKKTVSMNTGDEMESLLAELRALQFTNAGETASSTSKETSVAVEPVESKSENAQAKDTAVEASDEQKVPLKELIPDDPTQVVDHFALAETLFSAGEKELAAKYYQQALNKYGKNFSETDSERGWILFQLGNCYYEIDPGKAELVYEQLMREHSGSEWASCASVKRQVLRWMLSEKPLELIEDAN